MILVRVSQGLGNQMFQYSFGSILADKVGIENVKYDDSRIPLNIAGRKMNNINNIFSTNFNMASFTEIRNITGVRFLYNIPKFYNYISKDEKKLMYFFALNDKLKTRNDTITISEPITYWDISQDFVDSIIKLDIRINKNYYFVGFWEDIKYLNGYKNYIQKIFKFKNSILNNNLMNEILGENSVSIHVRRGDYLKLNNSDFNFNLCSINYYKEAIKIINTKVANPKFFVFSDDKDYVYKAFSFLSNKIVVSGYNDYDDMQLMSLCKHNIIANSTFSFWGAYLNLNNDKIVISPKTHYIRCTEKSRYNVKFPVEDNWITLDNTAFVSG